MQGSESEAVFDSLNLNPQLFINEVLNAVDDMVDGAFDFYHGQATEILGDLGEDKSGELSRQCFLSIEEDGDEGLKGVSSLRPKVQAVLDKRLGMWEKYCLLHCFAVPKGFSLPKADSSDNNLLPQDVLSDAELDAQLDSLREKLVVIGKESAELHRELHALEKQSVLSSSCAGSIAEAFEPFEQSSTRDMFNEMVGTASELRKKMETLKTKRREEIECARIKRIYSPDENGATMHSKGLSLNLTDLEEFVDYMKDMGNR
eukprot:TRINITY_DN9747_c0_g2_i2.p1 TRINITY_DN9747_c0_g2~~TRINITY_DN9747_c0_g2_i2.p1  ORF type:complete len:260 (+),score=82.68 TRINITY_DN9747_c0_g2_i2:134-913(+)